MNTLEYIIKRYNLNIKKSPVEIPNVGRDEDLTGLFSELGFKVGAEIGIERGVYSKKICDKNPGIKLYCIDPWLHYSEYREHVSQDKLDGFYEETKAKLAPYNCVLIRKTSMEAVKIFDNDSLDFVYIDGNHNYQNTVNDICEWVKKVRPGGIISGHDFRKIKDFPNHVIEAVTGYVSAYNIHPWFLLGTKECKEGEVRDRSRSYMWVRQ